jgi:hypothetical protein
MATPAPKGEGWGWPTNSKKAHYFDGARSLCSKWMYLAPVEAGDDILPEDFCSACSRAKTKRWAAERAEALRRGETVVR